MRMKSACPVLCVLAMLAVTPQPAQPQLWSKLTNPRVKFTVRHGPGLGLKVSKIAFGPSRGQKADELVDALVQDFVQSGIEVIDRQHVDALLNEHRFTMSGYVDQRTAAELGKILGPVALIFVNVQRAATEQKQLYEDAKDRQGNLHRRFISRTQAYLKASVQTVDLATGRIFQAVMLDYSPKQENETIDRCCAEYPSEFTLLDEAMRGAVTEVHQLFASWEEQKEAYFFDDKACQLNTAHALLKAGDIPGVLERTQQNLQECQASGDAKPKVLAHALYNVGLAMAISDRYDEALKYIGEAERTDPGGIYEDALKEARRLRDVVESRRKIEARAEMAASGEKGEASGAGARANGAGVSPVPSTKAESDRPVSADESATVEERLKRLDDLLKKKLITKAEYDRKRAELLKKL